MVLKGSNPLIATKYNIVRFNAFKTLKRKFAAQPKRSCGKPKERGPQMPSTQLQHCLHCKSVYPHRVIVEEHANTKIVHLICKNCNKCVNCDEPPLDPKKARAYLSDQYFAVVGGNETNAFKHVVSLIACNTQLAAAMFEYLQATNSELRQN